MTKLYSFGIIPTIEIESDWQSSDIYAYCGQSETKLALETCTTYMASDLFT